jgi:hypothetical protein
MLQKVVAVGATLISWNATTDSVALKVNEPGSFTVRATFY